MRIRRQRRCPALCLVLALLLALTACDDIETVVAPSARPTRTSPASDDADLPAYTLMVYLNGSDLESESGCASGDIEEMLEASRRFSSDDIRVVIETGGTERWNGFPIASDALYRFEVQDGGLYEIESQPLASMGDPSTLASFLQFAQTQYPAQRYGLILWNHGGGSVNGFGVDELYDGDGLTLSEMREALDAADMDQPLEFLGFDACLMATLEVAEMASPYARYLVASQEVEPGYGWNYADWMGALAADPAMDGAAVGEAICSSFMNFYVDHDMHDEPLTLSVVDLSLVDGVIDALEAFIDVASDDLDDGFRVVAKQRGRTHEFGLPTRYGGSTNLVDIAQLADRLSARYPDETIDLLSALDQAVCFSAKSETVSAASGLSLYFPYSDKSSIADALPAYQATGFSPKYVSYVADFASLLTGEPIALIDPSALELVDSSAGDLSIAIPPDQLEDIEGIYLTGWVHLEGDYYMQVYQDTDVQIDDDGTVLSEYSGMMTLVNGEIACLYEIDVGEDYILYSSPGELNGRKVLFLIYYDADAPEGELIGAYPINDSGMASKQILDVQPGDELVFSYYVSRFTDMDAPESDDPEEVYIQSDPTIAQDPVPVETSEIDFGSYLYGFLLVDTQQNEYYTDFLEISYE